MDYFIGPPSVHSQQVHRTDLYEVPILRMYGVTEAGARRRRPAPGSPGRAPATEDSAAGAPAPCRLVGAEAGVVLAPMLTTVLARRQATACVRSSTASSPTSTSRRPWALARTMWSRSAASSTCGSNLQPVFLFVLL